MEGAVDEGGPRRKFLRLLNRALQSSPVFSGPLDARVLSMNTTALGQGLYQLVGEMVAVILVHGGPAPHFFSPTLYTAMAYGVEQASPQMEDISDYDTRAQIVNIKDATSTEDLEKAIENASFLMAMAGCSKARYQLDDRDQLCRELTKFFVIDRCRTAYEGFLEGLRSLGLLKEIQNNPILFRSCFLKSTEPLTAEIIKDLFPYQLSLEGSNRRKAEADVATFWLDLLVDVEEKQSSLTLEHILIFATASDRIPPAGFECKPALEFIHDKDPNEMEVSQFPKAHTCTGLLMIPIHPTYQLFKDKMEFGILSSPIFGFA